MSLKEKMLDLVEFKEKMLNVQKKFSWFKFVKEERRKDEIFNPTKTQLKDQTTLKLNWKNIWIQFDKEKLTRAQLRAFHFKILSNSTSHFAPENQLCGCGEQFKSYWHHYECFFFSDAKKLICDKMQKLFNINLQFKKSLSYNFQNQSTTRYISIIAWWTLWRVRNNWIFKREPPDKVFIDNLIQMEIQRLVSVQIHRLGREKFGKVWRTHDKQKFNFDIEEIGADYIRIKWNLKVV